MNGFVDPAIESYCSRMTGGETSALDGLARATRERMRYPHNMSGKLVGQTLRMLVALSGSRRVLEIGMFTGYAALSMAEALPEGGEIVCCETNPTAVAIAEEFFQKAGQLDKLTVLLGRAMETLQSVEGNFDLVFIDADKKRYLDYVYWVVPRLTPGGVLVIDDALWKGGVLHPQNERERTIAELNRFMHSCPELENVLLPIRHGLHIARKSA